MGQVSGFHILKGSAIKGRGEWGQKEGQRAGGREGKKENAAEAEHGLQSPKGPLYLPLSRNVRPGYENGQIKGRTSVPPSLPILTALRVSDV